MEKFIGTKVVEAEPRRSSLERGSMCGYTVMEDGGHQWWATKDAFEKDYVKIQETDEGMMKFFNFDHLPEHLQKVSKPFWLMANLINSSLPKNAESTTALRKLLEAKDAAVRSLI